ncbi:uncharacterized protein LOC119582936 [Penaeus monodon]|uniref:uncharacterized protein LOC119582936 n=1 Tax=Penaeus monodon TaxID=6687 RepID=UPI0018A6EBFD|nr:uncharacterized protein LOC119582936 [Penaeus monodon]
MLHKLFIDLEKAYDRVPRQEVWRCMRKRGVTEKYVRMIQETYKNVTTKVRQIEPLWCILYADDIVLVAETKQEIQKMEGWRTALESRGLKISRKKTEYFTMDTEGDQQSTIQIDGLNLKRVDHSMTCGIEIAPLRKVEERKLDVAEMKMLRWMVRVTKMDCIRNNCIRGSLKVTEISKNIQESRLRWYRHLLRRNEDHMHIFKKLHKSKKVRSHGSGIRVTVGSHRRLCGEDRQTARHKLDPAGKREKEVQISPMTENNPFVSRAHHVRTKYNSDITKAQFITGGGISINLSNKQPRQTAKRCLRRRTSRTVGDRQK